MSSPPKSTQPSTAPSSVPGTSKSDQLQATLTTQAASDAESQQKSLRQALASAQTLAQLDSADESIKLSPARLRIAKVLKALEKNPSPHARQTLVDLAKSPEFTATEARQQLLIDALAPLRPAPAEAVAFWDAQSRPDSSYTDRVIQALCANGSKPAMELLAKRLADDAYDMEDRLLWMRFQILTHRNDLGVLEGCERMLGTTLPADLRPPLVEALCDYKEEWYMSADPPEPPDRAKASKEAREALLRICRHALTNVPMDSALKQKVQNLAKELERSK